ncbi:hypothetical protein R1A27_08600 [Methylobacterium sp. NMS12]|uniref:hypothetical protein n=1 Tax=Methylobacterium sp. NMS12 TaxID=3079766 RepID=UPI003F8827DC
MDLDYAWEKTMVAVMGMASSPESIHQRIANAYVGSLIHIDPEQHLPLDLRPLFEEIRTALTETPAQSDEGSAVASARAMSTERATDVARQIVALYGRVSAALP